VRVVAAIVAASCILLAGCAGGNAVNTGPFGNGGTAGVECAELSPGNVLTFGFEEFKNSGSASATISKVALAEPSESATSRRLCRADNRR
jgi:hypothetical protein